ncbi:hypothetical protein V4U86_28980 [Mycobacterium sp. AMU20-3851]|uniref:hypothetical protein n=1 Tax=Mycobacterium sp. AMU20-3851 TaxID=3122055 RepID=UPI0037542EB6
MVQPESGDPAAADLRAAHDRVRRDLAALGADDASAEPAPADVTAAIRSALRRAPPPAHRVSQSRPVLVAGIIAAVLAVGLGLFAMIGADADRPVSRDPGPTARHITVQRAPATVPLGDVGVLELLDQPASLGGLADPQGCLQAVGLPADTPILGARPVSTGVLLVLPAPEPSSVIALVVAPQCPAAGAGELARTRVARP